MPKGKKLTHLDESGAANMVDVGAKPNSERIAEAKAEVHMNPETLALILTNSFEKGDVISTARIAGIMAAKETSRLIPLCHPLPISQIKIDIDLDEENSCVNVTTMVKTNAKTGVEMEALTAASITGLTIYDMCKAVDRNMNFKVWLASKSGGRSGNFVFDSPPRESST
ncbi:MAG: cyclic pyranopterin monophosphate synthase MoaC [Chloroflexota bacterium]|nr:cyclic pyranopterin monophosphate synthase MoaC [Chloroflexota bacterium]